jgi:hypothetical protein
MELTQNAYGSEPATRQSRARSVLVCTIELCYCRAKPTLVASWARPRETGGCHTSTNTGLIFIFYFMYSEQTYSTAPTGWSPIQALAGAQPYEWYVTFKKLFSCTWDQP